MSDDMPPTIPRIAHGVISRQADLVQRAATEHAAIADRLLHGDIEGAAAALEVNRVNGMTECCPPSTPRLALTEP